MPAQNKIKQSLREIDSLPAMPAIAQKMLALPLDTTEGEAQLLKLITQDPQISARIVGLSNSSLFNMPSTITSVNDAAMLLGLTQVKSIAIGMATITVLAKLPEGKLKSMDLWAHSMAIATTMRAIARHMPANLRPIDDQIFLAGLLHDIGFSTLSYLDTETSNRLHERLNDAADTDLFAIEQEIVGIHHGEIGAQLGIHWGLPEELIAVMRYHHTPDHPDATLGLPMIRLVNIAEKLLPNFSINEHTAQEITEQAWNNLGIAESKIDRIIEEAKTLAESANQLVSAA
ncbi:MAG: HDOD domain-containing protein [Nitrosomonas sp.]|nr:HDOD domain-containing protein [Nitrosomonas sp.]MBK7365142.1 HDOD domain-containing protein [Nitrosomonas sp.]